MIRLEQGLTALKARGLVPHNLRTLGQDYGAMIALVVLILFNLIFTRQFNSVIAVTDLLVHLTPTLILGVGMTLVIATGGIDNFPHTLLRLFKGENLGKLVLEVDRPT